VVASALLIGSVLGTVGIPSGSGASAPTWGIVPSPNTGSSQNNMINAVSCTSASACTAVGGGLDYQALIEQWNGRTWSIVPSPDESGSQYVVLNGVSCTSASVCMAVGFYGTTGPDQTLIEQWDGSTWSIVPSPDTSSSQLNHLSGVSCTSDSSCVAVGYGNSQTLIEQWDGSTWSIVPSPDTSSSEGNFLYGVSCTSASDCMAVGFYGSDPTYQALIEQWNGSTWSIVPSPDESGSQEDVLNGVSCTSASACTAVGDYNNAFPDQTLIEQWDGSTWSIVPSPDV